MTPYLLLKYGFALSGGTLALGASLLLLRVLYVWLFGSTDTLKPTR